MDDLKQFIQKFLVNDKDRINNIDLMFQFNDVCKQRNNQVSKIMESYIYQKIKDVLE